MIACFSNPPDIVLIIVSEKKLGLCFLVLFSLSDGPPFVEMWTISLSIIKAGLGVEVAEGGAEMGRSEACSEGYPVKLSFCLIV